MVLMRIRLSNIIFLIAILVYTEKKYCFISEKKRKFNSIFNVFY